MNVSESAKALGELIKEDPVTAAYFEASDAYKKDPELKKLIFEYNVQQAALQEEYAKPEKDQKVIDAVNGRVKELFNEITNSEVYQTYLNAQNAMNELIDSVNREITMSIFGSMPDGGCTHDCSSCHGGCGHEH